MTFKRGIILSGKKLYLVGIFMAFLFFLSACAKQDSAPTLPISSKAPDRTIDTGSTSFENKEDKLNFLKEYQYLDLPEPMVPLPVFEYEVPGFDQYKELVAEQLGYDVSAVPYIKTSSVKIGFLEPETIATVVMFEAYFYGDQYCHRSVLMAITNANDGSADNIFCKPLLEEGSYDTIFHLANIDGKGGAEILTQHRQGVSDGAGPHETRIYKFRDGDLECIFSYHDELNHSRVFDTGFTLTLGDGWTYTIENQYTDFSLSLIRKESSPAYFDKQGNITKQAEENNQDSWLGVGSIYDLEPVDIDHDGIFEIMTVQDTFLDGTDDAIGDAYTILKWNQEEGALNVVKAGFWTYMADYDDVIQEYLRRWREFRDNWYKDNDISTEVLLPTEAERHKHKSDDTLEVKTVYAEFLRNIPVCADKELQTFTLWDMDNDGISELIITQSDGVLEAVISVYSYYSSNGTVYKTGDHSDPKTAAVGVCVSDNPDFYGLFTQWWGGGVEHYGYLTVQQGELIYEELWFNNMAPEEVAAENGQPEKNMISDNTELINESMNIFPPHGSMENVLETYYIEEKSIAGILE